MRFVYEFVCCIGKNEKVKFLLYAKNIHCEQRIIILNTHYKMEQYLHTEMTGKKFNELIKSMGNPKLLKVLSEDQIHYGFGYKLGLNIDTKVFDPSDKCKAGGLYFTTEKNIRDYLSHGPKIAEIGVPDDARVYIEERKFKSDKIVIISITDVPSFFQKEVNEKPLEYIRYDPNLLPYVKNQAPELYRELCIEAVKQNGMALYHVKKQTPELCLIAVKRNACALKYVKDQTPEICMAAVEKNREAFGYVREQTPEICIAAKQTKNMKSY